MNTNKKIRRGFGTSMGVSSIIAIFVILVLIVFSALSTTTSKADMVLAQKTADGIQAFYKADCLAEEQAKFVSESAKSGGDLQTKLRLSSITASEVIGDTVKYSIMIDENRKLDVELKVDANGKITRELWQVKPAKEWVADDHIELYQP